MRPKDRLPVEIGPYARRDAVTFGISDEEIESAIYRPTRKLDQAKRPAAPRRFLKERSSGEPIMVVAKQLPDRFFVVNVKIHNRTPRRKTWKR